MLATRSLNVLRAFRFSKTGSAAERSKVHISGDQHSGSKDLGGEFLGGNVEQEIRPFEVDTQWWKSCAFILSMTLGMVAWSLAIILVLPTSLT